MYTRILVAIEHSDADQAVLDHVEGLVRLTGAELLLVHVSEGFVARHYHELELRASDEMKADREYLEQLTAALVARGVACRARLEVGDPATQLVKVGEDERVDLIAMSTHGHRFLQDLFRGSTADRVRHDASVPVLMVRAK